MTAASKRTSIEDADSLRVKRAALRVALWVALASVAIVGLITLITVVIIFTGSRADDRPGRRGERWSDRIVDVGDLVPVVLALGALGIVALSIVAWYVARRSTRPLAEALRVQRAFVADASHELRTPLTTLTSRIQLAQHRAERDGDVASALNDLRRDAAVMDAVLTDLLLAADAAGSRAHDSHAAADARTSAVVAADTVQLRASGANVAISVEIAEGLNVSADATALSRAIVALLDNAVRHSPPGGSIIVSAQRAGSSVHFRVADQGTGIRDIGQEHLFDRFVRSHDGSSPRGFGLGLALVRDIAERFGGEVRVERTSTAGTTFLLAFPAATH